MTLRLYAERKQWSIKSIRVELSHERIHHEDCVDCEEKDINLDLIRKYIVVTGDLDETQRQRLLEIAERCPVARTLEAGPKVLRELDIVKE